MCERPVCWRRPLAFAKIDLSARYIRDPRLPGKVRFSPTTKPARGPGERRLKAAAPGLLTINYARRIIAAGIKPVGRIPAAVIGQIVVATIHQHDGIGSDPPIPGMCPDREVNISSIAEAPASGQGFRASRARCERPSSRVTLFYCAR